MGVADRASKAIRRSITAIARLADCASHCAARSMEGSRPEFTRRTRHARKASSRGRSAHRRPLTSPRSRCAFAPDRPHRRACAGRPGTPVPAIARSLEERRRRPPRRRSSTSTGTGQFLGDRFAAPLTVRIAGTTFSPASAASCQASPRLHAGSGSRHHRDPLANLQRGHLPAVIVPFRTPHRREPTSLCCRGGRWR